MDLEEYFQKRRDVEREITEAFPVIVSLETSNGGRAGVASEVRRSLAAKKIADGQARLATREEVEKFRQEAAEAGRQAERAAAASRVQVTLLTEADLESLRRGSRGKG